ncbi:MAG: choline/carnitine O-acyltransferase, partial [Anaerolineae bacterium]
CTVCLDLDGRPERPDEAALQAHAGNPDNRWYHASLQLVVFGNARAACICNFTTYLDGNTMMRGGAEIQRRGAAWELDGPDAVAGAEMAPARQLIWQIPPQARERARMDVDSVRDNQQATFQIDGYGQKRFQELGLPPVPGFLLALQLASNRLVDGSAQISQFLTMSRYRCMDLTTAMISTPEVMRFADYLAQGHIDGAQARTLAEEAIAAQVQAQRRARQFLPLPTAISLFARSRSGLGQILREGLMSLRARALVRSGTVREIRREVLVSHPEIYPEIPVVGRPGVRLPYVKYYGLHYQMFPDHTVITMMPGMAWEVPNAGFVEELLSSLEELARAMQG